MKITKWLRNGHHGIESTTTDDLIIDAARALDKAYSHEILGEVLFEGEDGKIYTMTVEAVISEASPEYVEALMDDDDEKFA